MEGGANETGSTRRRNRDTRRPLLLTGCGKLTKHAFILSSISALPPTGSTKQWQRGEGPCFGELVAGVLISVGGAPWWSSMALGSRRWAEQSKYFQLSGAGNYSPQMKILIILSIYLLFFFSLSRYAAERHRGRR